MGASLLIIVASLGQLDYPNLPGFEPLTIPAVVPQPNIVQPQGPVEATRVHDTTDAVAWCVQEIAARKALAPGHPQFWTAEDVLYKRFLYVPPWGSVAWHQTNSYLVNSAVSQSGVIVLPDAFAGGWIICWDLRRLAPKDADLKRLIQVWDLMAFPDPYFHVEVPGGKSVKCRPYVYYDGKTYQARRFIPALHVADGYTILEHETQSFAPLLRADYFLRRLASTVDGGLYYHFIGFVRDGKRLTEAEIFKTVGLDVLLSRAVDGDDRAAMFQSGVTGKPRTVEQVQGAIGKARITYDIFDEDFDAKRHPIYELLDFVNRSRGKEIIFERANGSFGYILTNGKGELVDVAPPNLVSDHRTPEPVTKQLYPPLSCIRCHGPDGGIRYVRNDVPALLAGGREGDLDVFDDLTSKQNRFATVDKLASLYAGSDKFQNEMELARIRYADFVWAATRGMGVGEKDNVVKKAAESLSQQFGEYWYPASPAEANISADQAALELGYRVGKPGDGAAFLKQTLRPGRVDVTIGGVPVEFADPSLGALRRGLTIRRSDFERVYVYAAYQILQSRKTK